MKLKRYIEFLNESVSIHKGNFKVTSDMVSNGKMIKEMIPREVAGDFDCSDILLTSLEGSPKEVNGSFWCPSNQLSSLEGCPKSVGGHFGCRNNLLTTLKGCSESIDGGFDCSNNKLVSLEGMPKSIGADFWCYDNLLISLKGGPESVGGSYDCKNNLLLSLEGGPETISGNFYCYDNKVDLEIEAGYILSGFRNDDYDGNVDCKQYYLGLLKYMIHKSIDLTKIKSWPKDFLTDNIIRSVKGINKFKL